MTEIDKLDEPVVVSRRAVTIALSWLSTMKHHHESDKEIQAELEKAFHGEQFCAGCGHSETRHLDDGWCPGVGETGCPCAQFETPDEDEDDAA